MISQKTLLGFKHFRPIIKIEESFEQKIFKETMVESVDICSEAGDPTFWLISIS